MCYCILSYTHLVLPSRLRLSDCSDNHAASGETNAPRDSTLAVGSTGFTCRSLRPFLHGPCCLLFSGCSDLGQIVSLSTLARSGRVWEPRRWAFLGPKQRAKPRRTPAFCSKSKKATPSLALSPGGEVEPTCPAPWVWAGLDGIDKETVMEWILGYGCHRTYRMFCPI